MTAQKRSYPNYVLRPQGQHVLRARKDNVIPVEFSPVSDAPEWEKRKRSNAKLARFLGMPLSREAVKA